MRVTLKPDPDPVVILSAISRNDASAITLLAEQGAKPGAILIEIGSWTGYSAFLIATIVKACGGCLFCVDHWKGNEETEQIQEAKDIDMYGVFEYNLMSLGLWNYIKPMKMDSISASKEFPNQSIDFLFMDADHRYKQFSDDLRTWYPKIKSGGIICGHDCEGQYSLVTEGVKAHLDKNLDVDFSRYEPKGYHAGVIRGLFDYFGDEYSIMPGTAIWAKVKE